MSDPFPEDTLLVEIRGVYDGWSVALFPDGTIVNRWADRLGWERQYQMTEEYIAGHREQFPAQRS